MEIFLILGQQVLVVVDACHGLLCSEGMGKHACCDVATLIAGDTHEEISIGHAGILQRLDAGW